jgi:hypothetical protein
VSVPFVRHLLRPSRVHVSFKLSLKKIESVDQGKAEFVSQGAVEYRISMLAAGPENPKLFFGPSPDR